MNQTIIKDEAHWHELRAKNIGASEAAVLFDVSPYKTKFTLWCEKAGKIKADTKDNARMLAGRVFEQGIARGLNQSYDAKIHIPQQQVYLSNGSGLGATPDAWVTRTLTSGKEIQCPVDLKFMSYQKYKEDVLQDDGTHKCPLHYAIQLQQQMLLSGAHLSYLGVYVESKGFLPLIEVKENAGFGKKLLEASAAFWKSIKENKAPPVVGDDRAALSELLKIQGKTDKVIELHDVDAIGYADEYLDLKAKIKALKDKQETALAKLSKIIQDSGSDVALLPNATIKVVTRNIPQHIVKERTDTFISISKAK